MAGAILKKLMALADKQAAKTGSDITGDVRIDFTSDELSAAIRGDLTLSVEVKRRCCRPWSAGSCFCTNNMSSSFRAGWRF